MPIPELVIVTTMTEFVGEQGLAVLELRLEMTKNELEGTVVQREIVVLSPGEGMGAGQKIANIH